MKHIVCAILFMLFLPLGVLAQEGKDVREKSSDAMRELEEGKLALRFFDALSGKPIQNGKVSLKGIGDFLTDFEGRVFFEPPSVDGDVSVTFSAAGYIPGEFDVPIANGSLYFNRFSISPILDVHQVRVVLDWGDNPRDLDLHFLKTGGYHISYRDMHTLADGGGQLDRDDTHGYGPETITVKEVTGENRYECYVHDYSDRNDRESTALSSSRATVKLYGEGRLLRVFVAPANLSGTTWHVFEFLGGQVREIGTVTSDN